MEVRRLIAIITKSVLRTSYRKVSSSSKKCAAIPTIQEIRTQLQQTLGASSAWIKSEEYREKLAASLPQTQSDLMPRRMQDSYYEAIVPLSDPVIREKYKGLYDNVRLGQLLENLDTFAVHISYLHNNPYSSKTGESPLSIVTAMVDEIKIHNHCLESQADILLKGHVTWTGKSSMEIKMWLTQLAKPIIDATFVMVARDPLNRSAIVYPLLMEDPKDKALFQEGEKHKIERLEEAKYSLLKYPPKEEERQVVHDLFLQTLDTKTMSFRGRQLPEDCVWMEDTKLKNSIICFPEKRNIHNKIFGGFLMRTGFELAWANACIFSKTRPHVTAVDDILFRCPVQIGSLLLISSQVCFSQGKDFHIRAHAEVMDPHTGVSTTCNTFNFSFTCDNENLPTVMPRTYGESMLYLDGRRHYNTLKGISGV
ncbi:acyl-coenzyme A thioesterase 9, mitochondrial-like [Styela clava]